MSNNSPVFSERKEFNPVLDKMFKNAGIVGDKHQTQTWEQLEAMYQAIGSGIVEVGNQVNVAVKTINNLGVTGDAMLVKTVEGLTRDIGMFTEDLIKIKSRHSDMSGNVKDGEDLVLCLSCYEDYYALNGRLQAVLFPAMLTVTEAMMEAQATKAKQDELDPSVITDVEIKETPNVH
jgi:hypothetical protein